MNPHAVCTTWNASIETLAKFNEVFYRNYTCIYPLFADICRYMYHYFRNEFGWPRFILTLFLLAPFRKEELKRPMPGPHCFEKTHTHTHTSTMWGFSRARSNDGRRPLHPVEVMHFSFFLWSAYVFWLAHLCFFFPFGCHLRLWVFAYSLLFLRAHKPLPPCFFVCPPPPHFFRESSTCLDICGPRWSSKSWATSWQV